MFSRIDGTLSSNYAMNAALVFCYNCQTYLGKTEDIKKCQCMLATYCSFKCQGEDFPGHEAICKKIVSYFSDPSKEFGMSIYQQLEADYEMAELLIDLGREKDSRRPLMYALGIFNNLRWIGHRITEIHQQIPLLLLELHEVDEAYHFLKLRQLKAKEKVDIDLHYHLDKTKVVIASYLQKADILEDLFQIEGLPHDAPTLTAFCLIKAQVIRRCQTAKLDYKNFSTLLSLVGSPLMQGAVIEKKIRQNIGLLDDQALDDQFNQLVDLLNYANNKLPDSVYLTVWERVHRKLLPGFHLIFHKRNIIHFRSELQEHSRTVPPVDPHIRLIDYLCMGFLLLALTWYLIYV